MSKQDAILGLEVRKRAYATVFGGQEAGAKLTVLEDLSRFCREHVTTFVENERLHCVLEGRREVMLRIRDHLKLTPEELYEKYK